MMLQTFLSRWNRLTRNQQLMMGAIAALLVFGVLWQQGAFSPHILLARIAIIVIAFPIHEFGHAWMANYLGDRTPRSQGRLTLNPMAHIDPVGAIFMLAFGFGWGKPVTWSPYGVRGDIRRSTVMLALAGPIANLILATLTLIILKLGLIPIPFVIDLLGVFVFINVLLFVFNMIPIPPLDGSHILFAYLPASQYQLRHQLLQIGPFLLLAVILWGDKVILGPTMGILRILRFITGG